MIDTLFGCCVHRHNYLSH